MRDNSKDDEAKVDREISLLIRAKFPIISIVTFEERRVLARLESIREDIIKARQDLLIKQKELTASEDEKKGIDIQIEELSKAHQIIFWSYTSGTLHWTNYETKDGVTRLAPRRFSLGVRDSSNPVDVLLQLRSNPREKIDGVDLGSALFVFADLHPWLDRDDRGGRFNIMLVRALRDLVQLFKFSQEPRSIILLSPRTVVPLELSKDIQIIDYPLPTIQQLKERFEARIPIWKSKYGDDCIALSSSEQEKLMRALSGLTFEEADNVLAKSLADNHRLEGSDIGQALTEKRQIIRKDGMLEFFESEESFKGVGGLELLLDWLEQRKKAFTEEYITLDGRQIELPTPKGILLIGVPGGGKSLVAKAVANAWDMPLLRLDIGRVFGGVVGQSEENMRRAIRVAESVAPAVVWLDEVEKAFPKTSGASDSGVSLRVMNTFLTWMQEKKAAVFVVATGNDISQVPPELTRKGRFDEIFYVGLPDVHARQKIFEIHTDGFPLSAPDHLSLAEKTRYYTGAEIEQVIKNALYLLPSVMKDEEAEPAEPSRLLVQAIETCLTDFVPLAQRKSADGRALLAGTMAKARMMARRASSQFEALPEEQDVDRRDPVFQTMDRWRDP